MVGARRRNAFDEPCIGYVLTRRMRAQFCEQNIDVRRVKQLAHRAQQIIPRDFISISEFPKALTYVEMCVTHQRYFCLVLMFSALNDVLPGLGVDAPCKFIKTLSV